MGPRVDHLRDVINNELLPKIPLFERYGNNAALEGVRDELPHSLAVVVDEIVPREGRPDDSPMLDVRVHVFVERDSQKAIIIGRGGSRLREVGTTARPWVTQVDGLHARSPQTTGTGYLWSPYVDEDETPVVHRVPPFAPGHPRRRATGPHVHVELRRDGHAVERQPQRGELRVPLDQRRLRRQRTRCPSRGRSAGGVRHAWCILVRAAGTSPARPHVRSGPRGGRGRSTGRAHVLSRFTADEASVIESAVSGAVDAIVLWSDRGVIDAMNIVNRPAPEPPSGRLGARL